MNNNEIKKLCLSLIYANTEQKVIEILKQAGYWDNDKVWRYYSDYENNFNNIGNQQSKSDAALVEKIINSIDARLTNECLVKKIDPEGPSAPNSIRQAVAAFFEESANQSNALVGRLKNWPSFKRTEVAKGITLATTGFSPQQGNPCITISDCGEGQTPDMIPNTFLSLTGSNKMRIPFVQGKFNMGGTGVLKFCGKNNLQLIVSRRNPKLLKDPYSSSDLQWSFTLIRRKDPEGNRRSSVYHFLAPIEAEQNPCKGSVLRFTADSMPIFPEGQNPYHRESEWGTLIKLYEYSLTNKSNILRKDGLLRRIDVLLPNIALPIRLHECRQSYGGHAGSYETTLSGLAVRLEDDKSNNIEDTWSFSITVSGEKLSGTIYVFKLGVADTYRKDEGIIFTLNGQTHGHIPPDFFRRKSVGLSYIANSLLVILDCSEFSGRAREDLFMNSRDRLCVGELQKEIENELTDILKRHEGLRASNERRRREMIESATANDKPLEEVLKTILKHSPTLSALFLKGTRLSAPFKSIKVKEDDKPYSGKKYPSFFKFKGIDYGKELHRECHINMRYRITFETNATNDYLNRDVDPGEFKLFLENGELQTQVQNSSINLHNGIATLSAKLPDNCLVGDQLTFIATVTDSTQIFPFLNRFKVKIREAAEITGGNGERIKNPTEKEGKDREAPSGIALPDIKPVYEAEWNKQDPPFDKYTALRIRNSGHSDETEADSYDFKINMDNIFLNNELKLSPKDASIIKARFKYGLVLLGLALIHDDSKKNKSSSVDMENDIEETEDNIEDMVEQVSKAFAPILLPMIESLGCMDFGETLNNLSEVG